MNLGLIEKQKVLGYLSPVCHSCWVHELAVAVALSYTAFTIAFFGSSYRIIQSLPAPFLGCSRDSCPCHKSREEIRKDKIQAFGEIWAPVSIS